jgi:hypothetical protein
MPSGTGLRIHETNSSDDGRNIGIGKPLFEADDSNARNEKGENTAEAAAATVDEVAKQGGRTEVLAEVMGAAGEAAAAKELSARGMRTAGGECPAAEVAGKEIEAAREGARAAEAAREGARAAEAVESEWLAAGKELGAAGGDKQATEAAKDELPAANAAGRGLGAAGEGTRATEAAEDGWPAVEADAVAFMRFKLS